jgi:hypothetical protein
MHTTPSYDVFSYYSHTHTIYVAPAHGVLPELFVLTKICAC